MLSTDWQKKTIDIARGSFYFWQLMISQMDFRSSDRCQFGSFGVIQIA